MIRQISAVIIGYAIFVISSILFFKFSEVNPHADASRLFMVWTFVYGTVFFVHQRTCDSVDRKD